jgi:hypothetical protein
VYALGMTLAELLRMASPVIMNHRWQYVFCQYAKLLHIQDKTLYAEVKKFLQLVTDADPQKRPSPEAVVQFFKSLYQQHPDPEPKAIMLLDVAEIGKTDSYLGLWHQLNPIYKFYDEVWFIDADKVHAHRYLELRRELEGLGAKVGDRLFYACRSGVSVSDLLRQLPDYVARQKANSHHYTFQFFTSNSYPDALVRELHGQHLDVIIPDTYCLQKPVLTF